MKRLIPKNRIYDLRFGQFVYSALYLEIADGMEQWDKPEYHNMDALISSKLFYLENDQLEEIIQKYLEGYGRRNKKISND